MELRVQPLTTDLWPAIENLFESGSACKRCWCMYWRIGSAYRNRPAEANKAAFHEIVQQGPPPGLLAFDGGTAVGWCQLSSRDSLPGLDRSPHLKRVDDLPVWCISCFYVRKGYRKRGVTSGFDPRSAESRPKSGAAALEAYPLDGDLTSSSSFTGFASTFLKWGIPARCPPRASSADHASYVQKNR